jgi:hypothetical protein
MNEFMDITPNRVELRVLDRLQDGDQLAEYPDGRVRLRRTEAIVRRDLVRRLIDRHWITTPGLPLFCPRGDQLTPRGIQAADGGRPRTIRIVDHG